MNPINLSYREDQVYVTVQSSPQIDRATAFSLEDTASLLSWLEREAIVFDSLIGRMPKQTACTLHTPFKKFVHEIAEKLNLPFAFLSPDEENNAKAEEALNSSSWQIHSFGYAPGKDEYAVESLFAVGNGFLCLRGTTPEMKISDAHYPATYMAGLYNEAVSLVHGQEISNEDFVNAPNLQYLSVAVEGERIDFSKGQVLELERCLDLRTGLFEAQAIIRTAGGKELLIRTEKIASMADRHHYSISYQVTPLNFSGELQIVSEADGEVYNYNVARYRSLTNRHLDVTEASAKGNQTRLVAQTKGTGLTIVQESCLFSSEALDWQNEVTDTKIIQTALVHAEKEQTIRLEKSVFAELIKDGADGKKVSGVSSHPDFTAMYKASAKAWQKLWQEANIEIKGDMMSEKLLHLHTYHLLVSGSPMSAPDLDTSITARGLHGEAYRGHIFWDELFILPFYILHFPETARELLMYRYRRLGAAKKLAHEAGFEGAMFPWQSGLDGSEQSQEIHLNPVSGGWDDDHSRLQRHVSLAIAYNVWFYFKNTGDTAFMETAGLELLLEIAKFWISIADFEPISGRFSIAGVMGPDEFHEAYPDAEKGGLTDNAYTNMMVVWLFEELLKLSDSLPEAFETAKSKTAFTDEKTTQLEAIMHQLTLEISEEGIIAQFFGYFDLKEADWAYYREKYGNIYRMDRILRAEGTSADNYQVAKQADSLMIFYMFEKSRIDQILSDLDYHLPDDYLEKNLSYYLSRTSHGSTLSRVVHAQLAAMVGNKALSWQLYQEAVYSDYQDIQGGTTAEGIHAGVMAATIYITLTTYGGVDARRKVLAIDPALPESWKKMKFCLKRQGVGYQFCLTPERLSVTADADALIMVRGQAVELVKDRERIIELEKTKLEDGGFRDEKRVCI